MEELHCIIFGRVQMVMFRDFTQRKARSLGLVGWVRNLPDGTVEVLAQGERDPLEKLLAKLHRGPLLARVDIINVEWCETSQIDASFQIAY